MRNDDNPNPEQSALLFLWLIALVLTVAATGRFGVSFVNDPADHRERFNRGAMLFAVSLALWCLFKLTTGGTMLDALLIYPLFIANTILLIASGAFRLFQHWEEEESKAADPRHDEE
uniref:Uncharacterized protein n=1 Tax=Candidatus Kentrum sp. LFY TaxID=2126342 RepID=A0A450UUG6_9GAMM|nr:MAG: hypothetical protein BECKLFY1418B_GA0070995_10818 [Candidatus Kentron sp. LFY]